MIRHLHVPATRPEDVIPHLAKQEAHWRRGYSAQELVLAWFGANGFPRAIRTVMEAAPEYREAELVDGFFEREVELNSPGRNSQTDLMLVVGLGAQLGVVAVEGKVDEPFSELIEQWNTTPGKQLRLERLCQLVGVDQTAMKRVRYQLLHRTASAIFEAKRYRAPHALMLVHSFSSSHRWFDDFSYFAEILGCNVPGVNHLSQPKICAGVSLRLGWVADSVSRPAPGRLADLHQAR